MLPKLFLACAFVFILASVFLLYPKQKTIANATGPIVFFGNSLTFGQGAGSGEDFPTLVGRALDVPIVNAGVSGNTTRDAVLRVDKDVLSKNPSIVVVEFGANDLFEHIDSQETNRNFEVILSKIKQTNAKIVILGVKIFLFNVKYETDLQSLAKKYNAIFVADILDGITYDNKLRFDDIHPNAKGYQKIAEKLTPIIFSLIAKK